MGYQVVTDSAGMKSAKADKPVLGLFASGNVPTEWTGESAAVGGTDPQRCVTSNPNRPSATPSPADSVTKAIQLLEAKQKHSGKGFFLQIEGASIDKQDHAADPCGQIGETAAFDRAVKVARDYAAKHPDTRVVTTADHGHTSQIVPLEATSGGLPSVGTRATSGRPRSRAGRPGGPGPVCRAGLSQTSRAVTNGEAVWSFLWTVPVWRNT